MMEISDFKSILGNSIKFYLYYKFKTNISFYINPIRFFNLQKLMEFDDMK